MADANLWEEPIRARIGNTLGDRIYHIMKKPGRQEEEFNFDIQDKQKRRKGKSDGRKMWVKEDQAASSVQGAQRLGEISKVSLEAALVIQV